jgi:DNA-directed RNA polymerase subunit M/transcription elongation factor TFIIS
MGDSKECTIRLHTYFKSAFPELRDHHVAEYVDMVIAKYRAQGCPLDELALRLLEDFTSESEIIKGIVNTSPHLAVVSKLTHRAYTARSQNHDQIEESMTIYDKITMGGNNASITRFACRKCGSERLMFYMKQVRSSDEPTSEYGECIDCGNKWRIC